MKLTKTLITAAAALLLISGASTANAQTIREKPNVICTARGEHVKLQSKDIGGTETFFLLLPTGNIYKPAVVICLGDYLATTRVLALLSSELDNDTWVDFEDSWNNRVVSKYRGKTLLFYNDDNPEIPGNSSRKEMANINAVFLHYVNDHYGSAETSE